MFYFYQSNQLDVLAGLIGPLMRQAPLSNPLIAEQVLVQSPGMAQWLKFELAEQLGVSANIEFPLPSSFIWQMFYRVLDDIPEQTPFSKEAMAWRLMRLLPQQRSDDDFAPLFEYLGIEESTQARKLWQLCQKIADLFDQYLVYRPHWMSEWEAGHDLPEITAHQGWQPKLWRLLVDDTVTTIAQPYHRGNLFADFIERLSIGTPVAGLPERIFIFGISALPPAYLRALEALAQHLDIHLLFGNPSQAYWGDVRDDLTFSGNPLLASMGKLGRDYLSMLAEVEKQELDIDLFVPAQGDSMLHQLQRDVLELENPIDPLAWESSQHKRAVTRDDHSISLSICHSARRELEVLHDQLLAMFEADEQLTPRDVIVMVPDINRYSPAIAAVFGSAGETHWIPYAISDRGACEESPLLQSFIELLALPLSRSSASGVLSLLDVPAIRRRFAIEPGQQERLRQWVIESGIRWGLDGEDLQRWSLPDSGELNSWLFGLKRMLLGYAQDEQQGLVAGILPYQQSQGMEATLIGYLADFVEALIDLRDALQTPADAVKWQHRLLTLLDNFYDFDAEEVGEQQHLYQMIAHLYEMAEECDYQQAIDPMVMYDYCRRQLSGQQGAQRFLAGPVNFCTLLPMRAIPFKVVCLLGMNDADYPRTAPSLGFDLMAQQPMQRGDRSRREDDRYLFLEAVLAAGERLYISYVGRSAQDNNPLEPSVLVSELTDYLAQSFCINSDEALDSDTSGQRLLAAITTEHPLQPFSPVYFQESSRLFSYNPRWLGAACALQSGGDAPAEKPAESLSRDGMMESVEYTDFQQFIRAPGEWLYKRRLNIYYPELEEQSVEAENFTLSGLNRYQLDVTLLQARLGGQVFDELSARLSASGQLPHGAFGDITLLQRWHALDPLIDRLAQLPELSVSRWAFQFPGCEEQGLAALKGWLTSESSSVLLQFRPGKLRAKDKLLSWIDYLIACQLDEVPGESLLLGIDEAVSWQSVDAKLARDYLNRWLDAMNYAWCSPLPLPIEALWMYASTAWDETTGQLSQDSGQLKSARDKAQLYYQGEYGEVTNRYLYQSLGDSLESHWAFLDPWVEQLLLPPLRYLAEADDE
ncbi:MAG: RecBCD enzyme subunit RecC [Candidatus Celerinatantimonas neptuna]|nr:MAG: RecBCD enzyme subunit RecC [Candidatus Celerinatantimonas neptuna]